MAKGEKSEVTELREKAELYLSSKPQNSSSINSDAEMASLIHELEVYHIELEMQNEELLTAKKIAEEALVKSQLLLKTGVENQKDTIIFSVDLNNQLMYFNNKCIEAIKNYYKADIKLNMNILTCLPAETSRRSLRKKLSRAVSGESFSDICIYGKSDPEYFECFYNPILTDENRIIGVTVSARNITERKKLEEKLFFISKAVDSSGDAIGIIDREGHHIYQNKAFSELFGYDTAGELEAAGGPLIITTDPELARKKFVNTGSGFSWTGEQEMISKTGRVFPAYEHLDSILDDAGNFIGIIGTIEDISDRKRSEEELRRNMDELALINVELEQFTYANQELKQFAYTASHQLQEPIRTVSNYLKIIEEDYSPVLDKNALGYIRIVKDATARMGILINTLLDFSRIGKDKKLVNMDFKQLIETVTADIEYLITATGTRIEVTDMPVICVYEAEIRQLFQNLITNGIKFQKKHQKPVITISSFKLNKDKWRFSISDNGIGIDPVQTDRIFDLFQRLHPDEEVYEGKGVGLTYCKKIVQLHQGEIWVESDGTDGSTFHFTLSDLSHFLT